MTATTMIDAWSITRYGGPERLRKVSRALDAPGTGEVLIAIRASGVSRADGMMRAGTPKWARLILGLRRPRKDLIGTCFAGEVVATGPGATRFKVGDAVFGEAGMNFGANASHIRVAEDGVLMPKPDALSFEEAAVLCDGVLTSWNFLTQLAAVRRGDRVLILGGSGSLGTAAVQIAAALGAEVTATTSARNAGLVASLGADRVLDYAAEDFRDGGQRYDVIFDTLGVSSFRQARRALAERGQYICPVLSLGLLGAMLRTSLVGRRRAKFSATGMLEPKVLRGMLGTVLEAVEAGRLAPVMDRTYPLAELDEAHRYVETGRKRGNVVVV